MILVYVQSVYMCSTAEAMRSAEDCCWAWSQFTVLHKNSHAVASGYKNLQNAKMTNQPAVMVGEIGQLDDKERKRAIRGNPWVYGPIRIDETIKLASGSTLNYESWMDRNTLNANSYCLDFYFLGGQ